MFKAYGVYFESRSRAEELRFWTWNMKTHIYFGRSPWSVIYIQAKGRPLTTGWQGRSPPQCPEANLKPCDTDKDTIQCNGDVQMSSVPEIKRKAAKEIDFKENALSIVKSSDFAELKDLKVLNLNTNLITKVEEGSFNGCTGLIEIRMNNNFLTGSTIPANLFRDTKSLEQVTLQFNPLRTLPETIFDGQLLDTTTSLWRCRDGFGAHAAKE